MTPVKTILKFRIEVTDQQMLWMPANAKILHVAAQPIGSEEVFLWVELDPREEWTSKRSIRIVGTGNAFEPDSSWAYMGTVLARDGALVLHVYEERNHYA